MRNFSASVPPDDLLFQTIILRLSSWEILQKMKAELEADSASMHQNDSGGAVTFSFAWEQDAPSHVVQRIEKIFPDEDPQEENTIEEQSQGLNQRQNQEQSYGQDQ